MQLNLRDMMSKGHTTHLSAPIDIADIVSADSGIHAGGPLQAEADATGGADTVIVRGHAKGRLEWICSRCLTVFERPLAVNFEEYFSNRRKEEETEQTDDEVFVNFVTEDRVDLIPYIKEHIVLELPRFPLCEERCQGLCPVCGINRNTESCSCNDDRVDPRWSGLQDLFQQ